LSTRGIGTLSGDERSLPQECVGPLIDGTMNLTPALVDAIFARHRIRGSWVPIPKTGIANTIYATQEVVLRVATDHPEAVADAKTESVAAPVAHAAGIQTPRLIAFDDSRTLVDRPFSLWERVHGETLGLLDLNRSQLANVWRQVGRQLFLLHDRIKGCADPNGYLDTPGRAIDLHQLLNRLAGAGRLNAATVEAIAQLIGELAPLVAGSGATRFLHNDIHAMNVMCSPAGELLAIIDWGDAGWGDPTLDFAAIPLAVLPYARQGYELEAPGALGAFPEARFIWDKLQAAMDAAWEGRDCSIPLAAFRQVWRSTAG
jgi:aminoglycoside phosphotransferase (APT) family kinase protein